MGWLYQRDPVDNPVSHLISKYTYEDDHCAHQPLDAARVGNTVYLAIKSTNKKSGRSYVFAGVILISNTKKSGFGYKEMSESMGPCECACPDRIMRLLSPISDIPHPSYSADWRARVAARKTVQRQQRELCKLLRVGSVVTLSAPIRFRGGDIASSFYVAHFRRKTPVFLSLDGPEFYCRLRAATLATATIADPPTPSTGA